MMHAHSMREGGIFHSTVLRDTSFCRLYRLLLVSPILGGSQILLVGMYLQSSTLNYWAGAAHIR